MKNLRRSPFKNMDLFCFKPHPVECVKLTGYTHFWLPVSPVMYFHLLSCVFRLNGKNCWSWSAGCWSGSTVFKRGYSRKSLSSPEFYINSYPKNCSMPTKSLTNLRLNGQLKKKIRKKPFLIILLPYKNFFSLIYLFWPFFLKNH